MFKQFKVATNVIPSEMHPPWSSVFKYPIGDLLKSDHHGVRPSQLPKINVLQKIEEIYTKLSKMKNKKFFEIIFNEKTFSAYVYKLYCPYNKSSISASSFVNVENQSNTASAENPQQLKQNEKSLFNFIHSIDGLKDESRSCEIFSGV